MKGANSGVAAYERLRHAIMRLELAPGAAVSEAQLVEGFGFSKAAVRAALARLRAEGLVVAEPRRGHVIAPLTMRDVLEIYELRLLLEPPATEAAAGRIERDELARLEALAEPAVDFDDAESLERFLLANRAIHLAIADCFKQIQQPFLGGKLVIVDECDEIAGRVFHRFVASARDVLPRL